MKVAGIVCALAAEARQLGPTKRRQPPLETLADGTLLIVSGMGEAAAARGARLLIEAGAAALASFGVAGGLDPTLPAGTLFLPDEVFAVDTPAIATSRCWRQHIGAAFGAQRARAAGRLLSSRIMVGSVADKATLFRSTGAAAVDMESLAVAQAAAARQLPFVAVRAIVDAAGDALPRAVTLAADAEGQLRPWRLLAGLLRAPAEVVPLLRLAARYRAASRSLAAVARSGALAFAGTS